MRHISCCRSTEMEWLPVTSLKPVQLALLCWIWVSISLARGTLDKHHHQGPEENSGTDMGKEDHSLLILWIFAEALVVEVLGSYGLTSQSLNTMFYAASQQGFAGCPEREMQKKGQVGKNFSNKQRRSVCAARKLLLSRVPRVPYQRACR